MVSVGSCVCALRVNGWKGLGVNGADRELNVALSYGQETPAVPTSHSEVGAWVVSLVAS